MSMKMDMREFVHPRENNNIKVIDYDSLSDIEERSWRCEDFWKVIHDHNLEDELSSYLEERTSWTELTRTELNDMFRFEYLPIFEALGLKPEDSSDCWADELLNNDY